MGKLTWSSVYLVKTFQPAFGWADSKLVSDWRGPQMLEWRGLALLWANNTHVNSPIFPRLLLKKVLRFWFLPRGKHLWLTVGRAQVTSSPSALHSLPHTTFQLTFSLPTSVLCISRFCSWSPSRITSCNQVPYPLQSPLWFFLLCPINQHTSIWLPLAGGGISGPLKYLPVPLLFFFVFHYCHFNRALGAHWILCLSSTKRHD